MKEYSWTSYHEWLECLYLSQSFMDEFKVLLAQECELKPDIFDQTSVQVIGQILEIHCSRELANLLITKWLEVARVVVKLNCENAFLYWPECTKPDEIGADLVDEFDDRACS